MGEQGSQERVKRKRHDRVAYSECAFNGVVKLRMGWIKACI